MNEELKGAGKGASTRLFLDLELIRELFAGGKEDNPWSGFSAHDPRSRHGSEEPRLPPSLCVVGRGCSLTHRTLAHSHKDRKQPLAGGRTSQRVSKTRDCDSPRVEGYSSRGSGWVNHGASASTRSTAGTWESPGRSLRPSDATGSGTAGGRRAEEAPAVPDGAGSGGCGFRSSAGRCPEYTSVL